MARTLLSIDPGNCTGFAYFLDGRLIRTGVTTVDAPQCPAAGILLAGCQALIVELPQVYRAAQSKGDPNDLIKVALGVGRWIERGTVCGASVTLVKPSEWKGQVPKDIHHKRVLAALDKSEAAAIPQMAQSQRHNALDAVALGLWRLGRLR